MSYQKAQCPACKRLVNERHPLHSNGSTEYVCRSCQTFFHRHLPPTQGPACRLCRMALSGSGSFIGGDELCGSCYAYVQKLVDPIRLANRKLVDSYQKQIVKMDAAAENDERVVYLRKEVKALREVISTKEYEEYRRRYDLDYPEARREEDAREEDAEREAEARPEEGDGAGPSA